MVKILACYCLIFILIGCENFFDKPDTKKEFKPLPSAEIMDFITRGYREGGLAWIIKAKKAEIFSEEKLTILHHFILYNYGKNGSMTSTASAIKGTLWEVTEDFLMEGEVTVLNEDKTLLETESLKYFKVENKIKTQDRVKITRASGDVLRGKGLIADISLKRMEILSQVSGGSY
jgi:LPS export ABC transporter protein LptC